MLENYTRATVVFLLARGRKKSLKMFNLKPLQVALGESSGKEAWMQTLAVRIFR